MNLSLELIESFVGCSTLSRGLAYHAGKRVLSLQRNARVDSWEAEVLGSQSAVYRTWVAVTSTRQGNVNIEAECSCYVTYCCKHIAAVCLAIKEHLDGSALDAPGRNEEPAPPTFEAWLAMAAEKVGAPAQQFQPIARRQPYLYFLQPTETTPTPTVLKSLTLRVGKANRNKKGFGAVRWMESVADWYNFDKSPDPSDFAVALKLEILRKASRQGGVGRGPSIMSRDLPELAGDCAATVLTALLQTGRCFWETIDAPLSMGCDRSASLGWHMQADGYQRLQIDLPPSVRVICVTPCFYVDLEAGCMGRLHLAFPEAALGLIGSAPPIAAEDVAAFCQALPAALQGLLPAPRALETRDDKTAPQPLLTIERVTPPDQKTARAMARLQFCYGAARVRDATSKRSRAQKVHDVQNDVLVRYPRDARAETRLRKQLKPSVFFPLDDAQRSASGFDYDLGPIEDSQAIFHIKETVLQPLEAKGWQLEGLSELQQDVHVVDEPWDVTLASDFNSAWFTVEMGIEIDGKKHSLLPIILGALKKGTLSLVPDKFLNTGRDQVYIPVDDKTVLAIPTGRLRQILGVIEELYSDRPSLSLSHAAEILALQDDGGCTVHGGEHLLELARRLRDVHGVKAVKPPKGFLATLRPYQRQGLSWLQFLRANNLSGLLADDMGLGKTLQALAHVVAEKEAGRLRAAALVVAPTSLMFNWQQEAEKFAPGLQVLTLHGNQRQNHLALIQNADIVLTTYGVLLRDITMFTQQHFSMVLLDESQAIKNPVSQVHRAVRRLKVDHKVCLTGTPMQNNLTELWSHFAFLQPALLGDLASFNETFRTPIEKHDDPHRRAQLTRRLRPFMLRRTKGEVVRELPLKTEIIHSITLKKGQQDLYEAVRSAMDERVRQEVKLRGMARSSIVVLDALLKLRQVCCDPRLVKLAAAHRVQHSAKLERLLELLHELLAEGHRVLVFSQFTSMLDLIAEALAKAKIGYLTLTGKTQNRGRVIKYFDEGKANVFLISLKAGGVGLNLTQADTVIHYDPWWNPAVESQATDRAHRIGQTKPVFVHKLIVAGSVEEKICALQKRKQELTDAIFGAGKLHKLFTPQDLADLFAPIPPAEEQRQRRKRAG